MTIVEKDKLIKEIAKLVVGIVDVQKIELQKDVDGTDYIFFETVLTKYKIIFQKDNREKSNI